MQYNDNPEFNDYLDEKYKEVQIENFSCPASLILFEMDKQAYIEAYNEYLAEQKEAFPERVMQTFPAPIAFYFEKTFHGYENNIQRLNLLRSTWESLIYILYAIAIGEIIDRRLNLSTLRIFTNARIKLNGNGLLSDRLGCKLEIIEKILEYNSLNTSNLIIGEILSISVIGKLRELNNERNLFSHIAAIDESQAKDIYNLLVSKVIDLLFEVKKIESVLLIQYKNTLAILTNIRFLKFDGHSLKKKNHDLTVDKNFIDKNIDNLHEYRLFFKFKGNNKIICLSPFAYGCLYNGYPHILFYKKQSEELDYLIFEVIADNSCEIKIERKIFDVSIQILESLLL